LSEEAVSCVFELPEGEIPAGSSFSIEAQVIGLRAGELDGAAICIRDAAGAELSRASVSRAVSRDTSEETSEDGSQTVHLTVQAPRVAGGHIFTGVLLVPSGDTLVEVVASPIPFRVLPHDVVLSAWEVPSAPAAGERFSFMLGLKCTCGCSMVGQSIGVFDDIGREIGRGVLGGVWPGTDALFWVRFEARAPRETGNYRWTLRYEPAGDLPMPHGSAAHTFNVKVVAAPETEISVQAIDSEKQKPVAGAHVLLHPYRGLTDAEGLASFKVARGQYRLVVSGYKYIPFERQITADDRVEIRAELKEEPPVNYWTL
jgi:hypothetical protein